MQDTSIRMASCHEEHVHLEDIALLLCRWLTESLYMFLLSSTLMTFLGF